MTDDFQFTDWDFMKRDLRQQRVIEWGTTAFGEGQAMSLPQRGLRLIEEAIELAQACGCDPSQIHKLVDYVYARPKGDVFQEAGGVGVCILALCAAAKISADLAEHAELMRILAKPIEHFTLRNQAKNDAGFLAAGGINDDGATGT